MRATMKLLLGLAALVLLPAGSQAARPTLRPDDMTLGDPKAKIVVVEYASLSCPHCAHFHKTVFPAFRAKYVDTKKVLFVYREYVTPPAEVAVPLTVLARCTGKDGYFPALSRLFEVQDEIYDAGTMKGFYAIVKREAASFGLSEDQTRACLTDQAAYDAVTDRSNRAAAEDGVHGTPTLVVNGVVVEPPMGREMDLATLEKAIADAQKRKR